MLSPNGSFKGLQGVVYGVTADYKRLIVGKRVRIKARLYRMHSKSVDNVLSYELVFHPLNIVEDEQLNGTLKG